MSQSINLLQEPSEIAEVLGAASDIPPSDAAAIAKSISKPIGIKHLLMVAEMARQSSDSAKVEVSTFMECLHTVGF